jgi:hypothetical protein
MTSDNDATWRDYTGLKDDKTRVTLYPPTDLLKDWDDEADRLGLSRSAYILNHVQQARIGGTSDDTSNTSQQEVERLKAEIDRLQQQLDGEQPPHDSKPVIDDPAFLDQFLTDQYKSLDTLLQEIVESGILNDMIRERVENRLYVLAAKDNAVFQRGYGWKQVESEAEDA